MTENWTREDLLAELEDDGNSFFEDGRRNNMIDLGLTISTVLASLVATVLATGNNIPHWVLAAVAAIPAAAASLQRIVGIRERSNYHFMYAAEVRSLATKLRFSNAPDVEEYAQKRAEIEVEMEKAWAGIGHSGAPGRAAPRGGSSRAARKRA